MIGVDYAWGHPGIPALHAAGAGFVMRYLSHDPSKNLTLSERQALTGAGLGVGVVWEGTASAALRGRVGGEDDAGAADQQAKACGLAGIPVYFALDWDATPGQQSVINDYLDGAAAVLGHSRVGVYGGYWPLSRARQAGRATYYWGTIAWSGTNWATAGWHPHIMQGQLMTLGGASCDWDTSMPGDIGLWPRPAPAPKPPAAPQVKPLPDPPLRVAANGRQSLNGLVTPYGIGAMDALLTTAKAKNPGETWGVLQRHYFRVARFGDPMPEGMIVYIGKP